MALQIKNCSIQFGGLSALSDISFDLSAGELLAIIGPNGAGKTTLFNLLTGVYEPTYGKISWQGSSLQGRKPEEINHLGIARTFQNIRLFNSMTVLDNVRVAFNAPRKSGFFTSVFNGRRTRMEEESITEQAGKLLSLFHLFNVKDHMASSLSYGEQRRLEIVRALATKPKLLLLDEPAAGMNQSEKQDLISLIQQVQKEFGLSIILIEHDMNVVMTIAPRILVLDHGTVIAEGSPDEIRKNPKVIEAYLGEVAEQL